MRITPCLENGKTAFVDFLEAKQVGWGSTEYIVLRPNHPLPEEFAYCLARSEGFRDFAIQSMTGSSGRQRVPSDSLSHFLLPVPLPEVVTRFGTCIHSLFARSSAGTCECRSLAALRDTLLPKLISGQLRIKDAERFVGNAADAGHDPHPSPVANRTPPRRHVNQANSSTSKSRTSAGGNQRETGPTNGRVTIDDFGTDEVMAAFRQACRGRSEMERDELLKRASERLGFQRLGPAIREVLRGHLRAAIRRKIVVSNGSTVQAETVTIDDYHHDELIGSLQSVMRKGAVYSRQEVTENLARHLGFIRVTDAVREAVKSAINGAIRREVIEYEENEIWRVT